MLGQTVFRGHTLVLLLLRNYFHISNCKMSPFRYNLIIAGLWLRLELA